MHLSELLEGLGAAGHTDGRVAANQVAAMRQPGPMWFLIHAMPLV